MEFYESYGKLEGADSKFDLYYWQKQGVEAIFEAASSMISDYLLLKYNDASEPRLQRTIEHFQKI